MPRLTTAQYRRRVYGLMLGYVVCMLLVWPQARGAAGLPLKTLLALLPALPVVAVIGLTARRVMHSDELEQRVHMVALGIASGVVAVLSLIGGFLCAAGVLRLGGDVLIWVFPLLLVSYSLSRGEVARRYGGAADDA